MFDFLSPYRFAIQIGSIVLIGVLLMVGYYRLITYHEGIGYQRAEAVYIAKELAARKAAEFREQTMIQKVRKAEVEANEREIKLRADYVAASRAYTGLRVTVRDLQNRLATGSYDSCIKTANASLAVFSECAARLGEVAEAADGHASDKQTLIDAWPK